MSLRWLRGRRTWEPDAAFFADCHRRLDALLQPAIAFWKTTVDWSHGGFFGLVDYSGRPRPEADKALIQQIRHLWTFSHIHRLEDDSPAIKKICDHQFEFVRDRLYVPERAGFHPSVSSHGAPRTDPIHHYQLAFGILGLSNYAAAFPRTNGGQEALAMAKNVFDAMVNRSYDESHGFDETAYQGRWCTHPKEINTQMHLMEAIAELCMAARLHGDAAAGTIEAVLRNQVGLIAHKGIVTSGRRYFCSRAYDRDWSLIDDREEEYGHGIELVYLIMAAAGVVGMEHDRAIVDRVIHLGRSVTESAYDRRHGKWFYSGNPLTGRVSNKASNFWVNFEALNGLATLYQLTGEADFLDKFSRVLAWLESKQINKAVGEWYCYVDNRGRPVDRDVFGADCAWMSFAWKSSYHSLRTLMTCKQWIAEIYRGDGVGGP